jgi:uncharacterized protein YkwD
MIRIARPLGALVLAFLLAIAVAAPALATTSLRRERCTALTNVLNQSREPDVRVKTLLCDVAMERAKTMVARYVATGERLAWHDFGPLKAALGAAGVCWTNAGEVVGWRIYQWWGASQWMAAWMDSPSHREVLIDPRYDRGGGGYTGASSFEAAVYYVLDTC